jgi:hypothetical protein
MFARSLWLCVVAAVFIAGCNGQRAASPSGISTAPPSPPEAPREEPEPIFYSGGFGPIEIGMSEADVMALAGPRTTPPPPGADTAMCDMYAPEYFPGLVLMFEAGKLTRISNFETPRLKLKGGRGLGTTASEIREAYGSALVAQPHVYAEAPAEYLTVWEEGGPADPSARGMNFETDEAGKVVAFHVGGPSILYVEGCW